MRKFEVEVKHFITIEAETLQEANEKMQNDFSEFETVDFYDTNESKSHEVIGHCEISGLSIFENDDFSWDENGVMWLNSASNEEKEG